MSYIDDDFASGTEATIVVGPPRIEVDKAHAAGDAWVADGRVLYDLHQGDKLVATLRYSFTGARNEEQALRIAVELLQRTIRALRERVHPH